MSPGNASATPTELLLRRFAETARQAGLGSDIQRGHLSPSETDSPNKAEKRRRFAESAEIANALRRKANTDEIMPLFDSDDPDVRLCAAMFLSDVAPELAAAARLRALAGRPTRDVLVLSRRARTSPPPRPTLQEVDDDSLIARFKDAAERQTACRFIDWTDNAEDMAIRNTIIGELTDILKEMKRRDILARLLLFLDSDDPTARFRAAQGCLRIAPERAVATLEAIAANSGAFRAAAAQDALDGWRNGDCLVEKF
jgi:hypothetical protein